MQGHGGNQGSGAGIHSPVFGRRKTFKCEAKRSDKSFPLSSPQISAEIGGEILSACPRLRVDVNQPDVVVRIEIREFGAYLHAGQYKGAGGMPLGSNGRGLLLLSGGIDSPVAGWMMAKRGVKIEALHFESAPYTSEQARDKVLDLAGIVAGWAGSIRVHVISLTRIQEELKRVCAEDYFTLLLRRCMMRLAEQAAKEFSCDALITGESVGQGRLPNDGGAECNQCGRIDAGLSPLYRHGQRGNHPNCPKNRHLCHIHSALCRLLHSFHPPPPAHTPRAGQGRGRRGAA